MMRRIAWLILPSLCLTGCPATESGGNVDGVDLNAPRADDPNARADLAGASLDLTGADLRGADLATPPGLEDLAQPPGPQDLAQPPVPPDLAVPPLTPLMAEWLNAHNAARAGAQPTPSPALPPLTWNTTAAQVVTAWVEQCQFTHNPSRMDFGENLAATTGTSTPTAIVQGWAAETANYNYTSNSCTAGATACLHYTQVVWRATTSVGCATKTCTTGCPFGNCPGGTWRIWACDYSPAGNTNGTRPY